MNILLIVGGALFTAGCGARETSDNTAAERPAVTQTMTGLSIPADLLITSLAIAAPDPVGAQGACEGAVCGDNWKLATDELMRLDLAKELPGNRFILTEKGQRLVAERLVITREGETTTVSRKSPVA